MRTARDIVLAAVAATIPGCWWGGADCGVELDPWGEMPDLDLLVGDTVEAPLADYFRPVECVEAGYPWWYAESADSAAVAVSVSEQVLTIAAVEVADSVRVTVATELSAPHKFYVRVRPRPAGR
ncbi:MAG: hypothetical protein OXU64_03460 [Gemmatimonadota bacterium]|nr:hypothetical protein [Gemmatimonadota bacterium]